MTHGMIEHLEQFEVTMGIYDDPLIDAQTANTILGESREYETLKPGQLQTAAGQPASGYKLAYVPSDYTEDPNLKAMQMQGQRNQAIFGGLFSLGAEGVQYALGRASAAKMEAEAKSRLAAGPRLPSDADMEAIEAGIVAPAKQAAAESALRAQKAIASSQGRISSRDLLESEKAAVDVVPQAAAVAQLKKADLVEKAVDEFEDDEAALLHFISESEKKTHYEPFAKFTGNLAEVMGQIMKYAPAKDYMNEVDYLRSKNVPDHIIAQALESTKGLNKKQKAAALAKVIDIHGRERTAQLARERAPAKAPPPVTITKVEPKVEWKPAEEYWTGKSKAEGNSFRAWALKSYPDLGKGTPNDRLDPAGNTTSSAFKNAWNKYGKEYLNQTTK